MIDIILRQKISVHQPKLKPKFTNIGYGNPRYNSMIAYKDSVLIPCGCHLRLLNIKNNSILLNKQIGSSQIFQIMSNHQYILIVNFQGFITLLNIINFQIVHQWYAAGKQIRHISFTKDFLVVSCQLCQGTMKAKVQIYDLQQIKNGIYKAQHQLQGYYYLPQTIDNEHIIIQYDDANPKKKSRTQTVLKQKIPIKHSILRLNKKNQLKQIYKIQYQQQILCACQNKKIIFYLQTGKRIIIYNTIKNQIKQLILQSKQNPHCIEIYKNGIIFSSNSNQLTYFYYNWNTLLPQYSLIKIKSIAIGGNLSIKPIQNDNFYLFNQNGMHLWHSIEQKTYTQSLFSITNCGVSFNHDASCVAIADFGGSVYILSTQQNKNGLPVPLAQVCVYIPIRSLVWCGNSDRIVFGCVGGGLYFWDISSKQAIQIKQGIHTINILRYVNGHVYAGTSDGFVYIYNSKSLKLLFHYQAHHPIHYQNEKDRQLFGSMKNYAEIWSLAIKPNHQQLTIVSSCQDQTQKVFTVTNYDKLDMKHHLKGHELAVTSIDWQVMEHDLGQIYVSCSDDKIIRFRNPKENFQPLFEIETSTIKEWHTLTYLSLKPEGYRVAIGSQNGYLFIYDIKKRQLLFGQKIHLGGIEGLSWKNNVICSCSSDLCISIIHL